MIEKDKTAVFIGNRDCYKIDKAIIEQAIIQAIESGITCFLNGGQGYFDKTCALILHGLKSRYPDIRSILVIPYRDFWIFNKDIFSSATQLLSLYSEVTNRFKGFSSVQLLSHV